MQMFKQKKGISNKIEFYIELFIGIVVLFKVVASLFPTLVSSGNELNQSGAPLGSLFAGNNAVVWIIVMAGLVILIVRTLMRKSGK